MFYDILVLHNKNYGNRIWKKKAAWCGKILNKGPKLYYHTTRINGTIAQKKITSKSHLEDPGGTLDIESLSISLDVTSLSFARYSLVQFTGTKTTKASAVMGIKIFKLHLKITWYYLI